MDWTKCNTKKGIESMITSLAGFNELVAMRKQCAKTGNLSIFYLFGRFELDPRGYLLKWKQNFFSDDVYDEIPPVLTKHEFMEWYHACGINKKKEKYCTRQHLPVIPPAHYVDPMSKEGWTVDTCHDAYPVEHMRKINLDPYVGRKIRNVKVMLADDDQTIYLFDTLQLLSKEDERSYSDDDEERYKALRDADDDYCITIHDVAVVNCVDFFHYNTLIQQQTMALEKFESEAQLIFIKALESYGFSDITVTAAPIPTQVICYGNLISNLSWDVRFYFHIQASGIPFGIVLMHDDSMILDLHESGVTSHEILAAAGHVPQQDVSQYLCFVSDSVLEVLYEVMMTKRAHEY